MSSALEKVWDARFAEDRKGRSLVRDLSVCPFCSSRKICHDALGVNPFTRCQRCGEFWTFAVVVRHDGKSVRVVSRSATEPARRQALSAALACTVDEGPGPLEFSDGSKDGGA